MEDMVPELEDLEKRGFFTKAELRSVVKKRTNFEYMLKRRAAKVADFVRYVEYEIALEELRSLRSRMMGGSGKRSLADYCIVRRVHFVLERATRKFRGDLRLWVRWLDFCRASHSSRQTSRVLAKAIKLHPTVPGLWTRAAAWEFEHKRDGSAARKLMQRGLRMCPKSQQLWAEYFHFELLYAAQLRARRAVLGLSVGSKEALEAEEGGEGDDTEGAGAEALLRGAVAGAVFEQAEAAFPDDLNLRVSFLRVLDRFEFEGKAEMEARIVSSIQAVSQQASQVWDVLARRLDTSDAREPQAALPILREVCAVYEKGLQASPSTGMFSAYLAFLHGKIDALRSAAESEGTQAVAEAFLPTVDYLAATCLDVHRRSVAASAATDDGLQLWAGLARRCGLLAEARAAVSEESLAAAAASTSSSPTRVDLSRANTQRMELAACRDSFQGGCEEAGPAADREAVYTGLEFGKVVAEALCATEAERRDEVWLRALELICARGDSAAMARFMGQLEAEVAGAAKGPLTGGMGAVAAAALEALHQTRGVEAARIVYRRLLALPPAGGALFHAILDIELDACIEGTGEGGRDRVKRVFEAAVDAYGDVDVSLWLRYVEWSQELGAGGGDLYWRAKRALTDPAQFVAAHQALLLESN